MKPGPHLAHGSPHQPHQPTFHAAHPAGSGSRPRAANQGAGHGSREFADEGAPPFWKVLPRVPRLVLLWWGRGGTHQTRVGQEAIGRTATAVPSRPEGPGEREASGKGHQCPGLPHSRPPSAWVGPRPTHHPYSAVLPGHCHPLPVCQVLRVRGSRRELGHEQGS